MLRTLQKILFFAFTLSLFTQVGKHFWPEFALVSGIRVDYLAPVLYLSDLVILVLGVVWGVGEIGGGKGFKFKQYFPFAPVVLLLVVELFVVRSVQTHLYGVLKLVELVFVAVYVKQNIRDLVRPFVIALAVGSVLSSLLALAQFIHQGSFQSALYFAGERLYSTSTIGFATMRIGDNLLVRPYAAFPHPNVLAYSLSFSSIYLLYLFPMFRRKYLFGIAFGIIQIGILVTFSRVLILLYLCWLAYFLFKNLFPSVILIRQLAEKNPNKILHSVQDDKKKWMSILGVLGIGLLSFVYGLLYRDRFLDLLTRPRDLLFRVESIQAAFEIIKSNWLIGTGLNNYFYYMIDIQKNFSPVFLQPPHNIFVLILLQTGILGLILFATFLFQTVFRLFTNLKTAEGFSRRFFQATMAVLIVTLVSGVFDHFILTVQQGQLLGAVLIGLAWSSVERE